MHKPLVSVLITNYNLADYLPDAIESIFAQTYKNWELIIIDDASIDKSTQTINNYLQKNPEKIQVIQHAKNQGIVKSLNDGIKRCKGNYVMLLDADDVAMPTKIQEQIDFLQENLDYGICGCDFLLIDKIGHKIGEKHHPEQDIDIKKSIFFFSPMSSLSAMMIRCEVFEKVGYFDVDYQKNEDLEFLTRVGTKYLLHNIPKPLLKYRIHGQNSFLKDQKQMIKATIKTRKKAISLGYRPGLKGKIFLMGLYIVLLLPNKFVSFLAKNLNPNVK